MKTKSFILFFFLLTFPLLHSTASGSLNETHRRKEIRSRLNAHKVRTRAPELTLTGYVEDNSLYLSFSQSLNNMKVRLIDVATGNVVYDGFLTGNLLIASSMNDSYTTLYLEIGSGEMKITGEIDID